MPHKLSVQIGDGRKSNEYLIKYAFSGDASSTLQNSLLIVRYPRGRIGDATSNQQRLQSGIEDGGYGSESCINSKPISRSPSFFITTDGWNSGINYRRTKTF